MMRAPVSIHALLRSPYPLAMLRVLNESGSVRPVELYRLVNRPGPGSKMPPHLRLLEDAGLVLRASKTSPIQVTARGRSVLASLEAVESCLRVPAVVMELYGRVPA